MTNRPAPYPPDTRAKGWRFELDIEQIQQSDTWALAPAELRPWLLMLWTTAWQQVPCGSMPADDEVLAAKLGMPHKLFSKHRKILMRGWWQADDGRLYHPGMTRIVLRRIEKAEKDAQALRELHDRDSYRRFREIVLLRDGEKCAYCGAKDVALQLDHVMPRSRGGEDSPSNLTPACKPCNASKGARTPAEWRASR